MNLPEFKDLQNFPVFIKQVSNNGHEDTDFIKIHANGTYEIINTFHEGPYSLMAYGIDTSSNDNIELLNLTLSDCIYIDSGQWENALNQLKKFLPEA
jgi:hypothetical protein